jgi:hypothetical protein
MPTRLPSHKPAGNSLNEGYVCGVINGKMSESRIVKIPAFEMISFVLNLNLNISW